MIAITRPTAPEFLVDREKKWYKETQEAILYYNKSSNTKPFEFSAYNDTKVKDELKKVFTKCAYCESRYSHTSDGDIEHFRPKGKVNGKVPETPGYYWLANDWENLFLSCQHCNQRRKHILYGENELKSQGKLDQFPLSDETKRLKSPNDPLDDEEEFRLLLNPCKDNPEQHFEYDQELALILSATDKGKKSIEVYALQRSILVNARREVLSRLFWQMGIVKRELERFNFDNSQIQREILQKEINQLLTYIQPDEVYAGMSRYFVRKFLKENKLL